MYCPFVPEVCHYCFDAAHCKKICLVAASILENLAEEYREMQEEVRLMEMSDGCYYDRFDY